VLTRFFTYTDETDEQLDAPVRATLAIMASVLKPSGTALTRLRSRCTTRWGTAHRGETPPGCCRPDGRPCCRGAEVMDRLSS